jgi:hypothetical protein
VAEAASIGAYDFGIANVIELCNLDLDWMESRRVALLSNAFSPHRARLDAYQQLDQPIDGYIKS